MGVTYTALQVAAEICEKQEMWKEAHKYWMKLLTRVRCDQADYSRWDIAYFQMHADLCEEKLRI